MKIYWKLNENCSFSCYYAHAMYMYKWKANVYNEAMKTLIFHILLDRRKVCVGFGQQNRRTFFVHTKRWTSERYDDDGCDETNKTKVKSFDETKNNHSNSSHHNKFIYHRNILFIIQAISRIWKKLRKQSLSQLILYLTYTYTYT